MNEESVQSVQRTSAVSELDLSSFNSILIEGFGIFFSSLESIRSSAFMFSYMA